MSKSVNRDGEIVPWKTPYNHDVDKETARTATYCRDESKTQQHFKDEQDINVIVSRVLRTGELPAIPIPPRYADLTTQEDYHAMLNRIAETNGLFYRLDPEIRAEYANDPGAWLQDVNTKLESGDLAPLREMGLDLKSVDAQIAALEASRATKTEETKEEAKKADDAKKAPETAKT